MHNRRYSPYQLIHLMKLRSNPLNCLLICDGVGVGKTISASYILYHQSHIEKKPSIVICPPILVEKWRGELKYRFGLETRLALDSDTFELMVDELNSGVAWDDAPIYIMPFSFLSRVERIGIPKIGLVVVDEVHAIRNSKTRVYKNTKTIAAQASYRVGLSATPINNSLNDLSSILSVLIPSINLVGFEHMIRDLWGSPMMDSLSSITTRFQKEQISEEFTQRVVETQVVTYPEHYTKAVQELVAERAFMTGAQSEFESIVYFRLAASSPRAFSKNFRSRDHDFSFEDPKLVRLLTLLAEKPNERWLIFTEFKETAKHIQESLDNRISVVISGDLGKELREAHVNIFRDDPTAVTIMTPVGSEGLDFQFCSNLVNYDLHWNPMKIEQRIGRIDRIGQEKDMIYIHNFVAAGSIDEKVLQVIGDKLALVSDSFADIMPIIKSSSGNEMFDYGVLESQVKQANNLLEAASFYNQFIRIDLETLPLIDSLNCNTDLWIANAWHEPVPWISNCLNWSVHQQNAAARFFEIVSAYNTES